MRTLSGNALAAVLAPGTGQVAVVLLTISHPDMAVPIRVCDNGADLASNGATFLALPFRFVLPDEPEDRPPTPKIEIDNVARTIVQQARAIGGSLRLKVEVVLASSPSVVEAGPYNLSMRNITYDQMVLSATLAYEDILNEPFPGDMFRPSLFPGLF